MNAVVFGGTGFIGSRLVNALSAQGTNVTAADAEERALVEGRNSVKAGVIKVDVATGAGFEKLPESADVVFNLAAVVRSRNPADPLFKEVNAVGAGRVAEYACRAGAWLVHSSSASVYGKPEKLPVNEEDNKNPETEYARSKLDGEAFCVKAMLEKGSKDFCILRYSSVYGPDQQDGSVLPLFLKRALSNLPLSVYDSRRTQDFVFVDDVTAANLFSLDKRLRGVYNVGSGVETTMIGLAETVVRVTRSKSRILENESGGSGERGGSESGFRMKLDVSKIGRAGFKTRTSLEDGLKKTLAALSAPAESR